MSQTSTTGGEIFNYYQPDLFEGVQTAILLACINLMPNMKPNSKFWRHRKVYVTGGAGLLGSELVRYFVEAGSEVVALVRDEPPSTRFEELGLSE